MLIIRRFLRSVSAVLLVGAVSCEPGLGRSGICQPATALAIGGLEHGEAYHDDCRGPAEWGDFFAMSLASQTSLEISMVPEGSFAPTITVYRGSPGDATPLLVAGAASALGETLAIRLFLAPGDYFIVAGTSTRTRAPYSIAAAPSLGPDCLMLNFVMKGVEIDGNLTSSDCEIPPSASHRAEWFEMWWEANDTLTITLVADSAVHFRMEETCCNFQPVFTGMILPLFIDTLTWGRRARPEGRPHRLTLKREVMLTGPGAYWMKIE